MESILICALGVIVIVALAVAIYFGTGGRAWFGNKEHPERLLSSTVQLLDCDGFGSISLPAATVAEFDPPEYRLDFVVPVEIDGRSESFVRVRARHAGYPLCDAARRDTWAAVTLESGRTFIARLKVIETQADRSALPSG